jgi:hypothetical protein
MKKSIVPFLVIAVFSQMLLPLAYGQDADLQARQAKYKELKIDIGDSKYVNIKEGEIADAIIYSTYSSEPTRALAQKYKDDVFWHNVWIHASWATIALYWGTFGFVVSSNPGSEQTLVGVGIGISILGGASMAIAGVVEPKLSPTVVQAYNEDLRKELNLSEADVMGL